LFSYQGRTLLWRHEKHPISRQPEITFFANFDSCPFDDHAAVKYGEIRSDLARKGTPIGPNDLMIAAIALVHDAVVVTHNVRDFSRVVGLKTVDWEIV
jgi:tRNA(fMet)-specific endonuclease VapC